MKNIQVFIQKSSYEYVLSSGFSLMAEIISFALRVVAS